MKNLLNRLNRIEARIPKPKPPEADLSALSEEELEFLFEVIQLHNKKFHLNARDNSSFQEIIDSGLLSQDEIEKLIEILGRTSYK